MSRLVPFTYPFASLCMREPQDLFDLALQSSRIFDQNFGLGLLDEDFLPPTLWRGMYVRPRRHADRQLSGASEVKVSGDKFQVMLDVNQFSPEELSVKTVDDSVVIHGKHEEKLDKHGFISREFTRRYVLPQGILPENVTSAISPDGVLTIEAPKPQLEAPPPANERQVPIVRTTNPAVQQSSPAPAEQQQMQQ